MRRGNRLEAVRLLLIRSGWNKCPQFLVITLCCEKRDGAWTPGASESKTGQTNGGNQKGGKTGRKEGGWERRCTRWFLWPCCGSLASWVLQRLGSERQTGKMKQISPTMNADHHYASLIISLTYHYIIQQGKSLSSLYSILWDDGFKAPIITEYLHQLISPGDFQSFLNLVNSQLSPPELLLPDPPNLIPYVSAYFHGTSQLRSLLAEITSVFLICKW